MKKDHRFIQKANKKSKYGNIKCTYGEYTFDSKAEYNRFLILKERLIKQEIGDLQIHPFFTLHIKGKKIGKIILDFCYYDIKKDIRIYEDVKGVDTAISKWKRKCVEAEFGIKVEIIK